ncbi:MULTISPECIES: hypothetical protein [Pseudomonas]|uniref:hypothetical protein n=1 Tax=Pseudomonas TaxID=286 RepID=UPI0018E82A58|nr:MULTISPECIES: hypothetical protein [Pseudomonas]MBJ2204591.1 hypothetical protein [Pseudomonas carnis]MBJ2303173.1 hypothetical protein [Pseudomonas sp. MF2846]MBK3488286.1 hypothetical protein [Pseudomonas sp. MF2857]
MRSFNLIDRLLGRKPEIEKAYAAALRGEAFTLEPGMKIIEVPRHPEAERIAESIRDYPEDWDWTMKGYKLIHTPSGFVLWVSNQGYGLAEVYSNGGKGDFSKPEQEIIWPAVEGWLARHKVGFTGRLPKARITGRSGTFWCFAKEHPWAGVGNSPEEAYRAWSHAISAQARNDMKPNEYLQVRSATL